MPDVGPMCGLCMRDGWMRVKSEDDGDEHLWGSSKMRKCGKRKMIKSGGERIRMSE